jgi:hypothetical protein
MANLRYVISIVILMMTIECGNFLMAQNCSGYEKKCHDAPKGFKSSSQSRAFSLRKMKKVTVKQTLFAQREYYLSACGKGKLGKIHLRVLADNPQRDVLYDNASDNFASEKFFQIESTIPVIIEIFAPHFREERVSECAGLFIAYTNL